MHKPSQRLPKINDNRQWLLIEIIAKYIMTLKSSPRSCQNWPYPANWILRQIYNICTIYFFMISKDNNIQLWNSDSIIYITNISISMLIYKIKQFY